MFLMKQKLQCSLCLCRTCQRETKTTCEKCSLGQMLQAIFHSKVKTIFRSRSPLRKSRSRSRSPREWRRGERNRSHDRDRGQRRSVREDHRGKVRLYVCNMPYDVNWQFLKDLFKKESKALTWSIEKLYQNLLTFIHSNDLSFCSRNSNHLR